MRRLSKGLFYGLLMGLFIASAPVLGDWTNFYVLIVLAQPIVAFLLTLSDKQSLFLNLCRLMTDQMMLETIDDDQFLCHGLTAPAEKGLTRSFVCYRH